MFKALVFRVLSALEGKTDAELAKLLKSLKPAEIKRVRKFISRIIVLLRSDV
jgi:hypothetical protein